jgi:hypothetical protein
MDTATSRKLISFHVYIGKFRARIAAFFAFASISISGCVNLDSPPPIPKSHRVVVNFTNQGLSALSDIPMGAHRIPHSQVIISGYQQGGVNFGLINGIVTVSPTASGGSKEIAAVKSSQQALQISLTTLAPAVLRTLLESSTFADVYTLEEDPSAPVLSIGGDIVLMFETESRIRPFVVLHATLTGPRGSRVIWAMRYAASVGAPRALASDEGWTVDGGAALQAVVSLEMQRALAVMFTDISSPFVRDRNSKTTVQGYFPFIKGRFQVTGYLLGEDANSVVFVPDVPTTSLLHGIQVMDRSITVFRAATANDPRMRSLNDQD